MDLWRIPPPCMRTELVDCSECGGKRGSMHFELKIARAASQFPIFCECRLPICKICKKRKGRFPHGFWLNPKTNEPEYIYNKIEWTCARCAGLIGENRVVADPELNHALLFLAEAYQLQNQPVPIFIIMYLASHGLELLLKVFVRETDHDTREFSHDIKKIYKFLQETYPTMPKNKKLVGRLYLNLKNGGIRFVQKNVEYWKTSPIEVLEYADQLVHWWQQGPTMNSSRISWLRGVFTQYIRRAKRKSQL